MSNRVGPLAPEEQQAMTPPPLDLMKAYVKSRLCYHSDALKSATVVKVQELMAYQIDLWTLMERRWWKQLEKPYNGEYAPEEARGSEWNYVIQKPVTVLGKKYKEQHNIEKTRWKRQCFQCRGVGITTCTHCNGRRTTDCYSCNHTGISDGKYCSSCGGRGVKRCRECGALGKVNCTRCKTRGELLFWYQLQIERYTVHSVGYQTNSPLTPRKIRKAPTKENHGENDQDWLHGTAFEGYFQAVFANQQNVSYPIQLDELTRQYEKKHLKKTKHCGIVKLKWVIQKLNIIEVEYELKEFQNKEQAEMGNKFKFYYYGVDKKNRPLIHETDYPQNSCGCF